MKITIDCSPEEANAFPKLLGVEKSIEELVQQELEVKRNKEILRSFQKEVFNGHDWSFETLGKHLHPEFIDHAAMPGDMPGLEGVQSRFAAWASAFEDAEEENIEMVGQGDVLAVLYDLHARFAGPFMGIEPTKQDVIIPGIEFLRFKDGKIFEHWGIYDFISTAEEIGADMTFTPRSVRGVPRRPEVAWNKRGVPDSDAVTDAGDQ